MPCKRTGRCCINAYMDLWILTKDNKNEVLEKGRWLSYHGCKVGVRKYKDGKEVLGVSIPIVCEHLKESSEGYSCSIYKTRPLPCKKYTCGNFTKEEVNKLRKEENYGGSSNCLV